jgi:hypothetical protein
MPTTTRNAIADLKSVLDELGLPVRRIAFKSHDTIPDTYIVFQLTSGSTFTNDDDIECLIYSFQITIASKTDYTDIFNNLITLLREKEITVESIGAEYIDADLDFAYIPINVIIMEAFD